MSEENKTVDPFQEKAEAFLKKLDIDTDPRGQVVFAGPVLKETLAQFGATMYAQGVIDGNKLKQQQGKPYTGTGAEDGDTLCGICDGTGHVSNNPCTNCLGEGIVKTQQVDNGCPVCGQKLCNCPGV